MDKESSTAFCVLSALMWLLVLFQSRLAHLHVANVPVVTSVNVTTNVPVVTQKPQQKLHSRLYELEVSFSAIAGTDMKTALTQNGYSVACQPFLNRL